MQSVPKKRLFCFSSDHPLPLDTFGQNSKGMNSNKMRNCLRVLFVYSTLLCVLMMATLSSPSTLACGMTLYVCALSCLRCADIIQIFNGISFVGKPRIHEFTIILIHCFHKTTTSLYESFPRRWTFENALSYVQKV